MAKRKPLFTLPEMALLIIAMLLLVFGSLETEYFSKVSYFVGAIISSNFSGRVRFWSKPKLSAPKQKKQKPSPRMSMENESV